jgi:hypothetical protein
VHPDITVGAHRVMHMDRGDVAVCVFCTSDGVLAQAGRQIRPGGDMENTSSLAQVLAWVTAGEAL